MTEIAPVLQPASARRSTLTSVPEEQQIGSNSTNTTNNNNNNNNKWRGTPSYTLGGGDGGNINSDIFRGEPQSKFQRNGGDVVGGIGTNSLNGAVFADRPWAAPSVQELTQQVGNNYSLKGRHQSVSAGRTAVVSLSVDALIVEGPSGDVISAAGSAADNRLATETLGEVQERGFRANGNRYSRANEAPSVSVSGKRPRSFGAVYEHRDCFGKPHFVGHTKRDPGSNFQEDARRHQGIRNLLAYEEGRSAVVWAGTGGGVCGPQEMELITERIVEQRAREQHLQKLQGAKPYSRHSY